MAKSRSTQNHRSCETATQANGILCEVPHEVLPGGRLRRLHYAKQVAYAAQQEKAETEKAASAEPERRHSQVFHGQPRVRHQEF